MVLKTNNSYRTILVDKDILEMLLTMKEERKIESDYVFCSPGFTLDTYGHISTQMQQDAAQKVGGFLRMNM